MLKTFKVTVKTWCFHFSPSPVIESRKMFCFTFLYDSMASRKGLVQTAKWSTSLKFSNFQKWWKITIMPIFICVAKVQMLAIDMSLERKFYQD